MWALKRGFVREVGGLGLVRNDLNSFILYSIDRIDYYFLLIKCVIETSIENFFLSAFHACKPDNGLGGTSLHGLVFLLGQFNLGENKLSKLVGWFGSSYCLE